MLIINKLRIKRNRHTFTITRITINISTNYGGSGDFCGDSEGCG